MEQMGGSKFALKKYSKKRGKKGDSKEQAEGGPGFVVTIAGYCPYKNIGELMDPAGVKDDQSKWGFVTRLLYLDEIVDGNSPFKLYQKAEIEHFKLEIGEVDLDAEMPVGIGLEEGESEKAKSEKGKDDEPVLIDPMTKEIISKVVYLDEDGRAKFNRSGKKVYKVNDHWFTLNCKFILKNAPKDIEKSKGAGQTEY